MVYIKLSYRGIAFAIFNASTNKNYNHNMKLLNYITFIGAVCAAFALQSAKADIFTSSLNAPNDAISPYTGPYGSVTINLVNSTTATVTFTGATVGGNTFLLGGAQGTDLNVNGTATASAFSFTQNGTGFAAPSVQSFGSGQVDGHGDYTLTIDYFDGFAHAFDSVMFTLNATGGTTWGSASDVLTLNADGFDAAAHIFVTSAPANLANGAIATGFAGERPGTVPDGGATVALLGLGLTGVAGLRARFGRR